MSYLKYIPDMWRHLWHLWRCRKVRRELRQVSTERERENILNHYWFSGRISYLDDEILSHEFNVTQRALWFDYVRRQKRSLRKLFERDDG